MQDLGVSVFGRRRLLFDHCLHLEAAATEEPWKAFG
jgi:hypothetical protein